MATCTRIQRPDIRRRSDRCWQMCPALDGSIKIGTAKLLYKSNFISHVIDRAFLSSRTGLLLGEQDSPFRWNRLFYQQPIQGTKRRRWYVAYPSYPCLSWRSRLTTNGALLEQHHFHILMLQVARLIASVWKKMTMMPITITGKNYCTTMYYYSLLHSPLLQGFVHMHILFSLAKQHASFSFQNGSW